MKLLFDMIRYADEVSINDEVLVREHDQLKAVKVKEVSSTALQGTKLLPL